jgi:hypothetical protein
MKVIPKINPVCRFKVYLVETSPSSATNPMGLVKARKMIKDRKTKNQHAELIQTWSCVSVKKLAT